MNGDSETVALVIETPFFARSGEGQARIANVAQILALQPGARHIIAYAIGSEDSGPIWDGSADVKPTDAEKIRQQLDLFVRHTARNDGRSVPPHLRGPG